MKWLIGLCLCVSIGGLTPVFSQVIAPTQELLFPHFAVGGGLGE